MRACVLIGIVAALSAAACGKGIAPAAPADDSNKAAALAVLDRAEIPPTWTLIATDEEKASVFLEFVAPATDGEREPELPEEFMLDNSLKLPEADSVFGWITVAAWVGPDSGHRSRCVVRFETPDDVDKVFTNLPVTQRDDVRGGSKRLLRLSAICGYPL